MTQKHSHPLFRDREIPIPPPEPEPKIIVPVEEFPVNVPSFVADDPREAVRRSRSHVQYADPSILQSIQDQAKGIQELFPNRVLLFVGSEEYDYSTITILEGLQNLGFTIYTLKKQNINSWFCNQVIESTAGLKIDFVLSNVGWGTRWSHYSRYQLRRFPIVAIDSPLSDTPTDPECSQRQVPDNADDLDIQPYCWVDKAKAIEPDVFFSGRIQECIYLPPGIHHESLDVGIKAIHPFAQPRSLSAVHIPAQDQGEAVIPYAIASLIARDSGAGGIHGWRGWVRWRGTFDLLNKSSLAVCDQAGTNQRCVWDALACGCLVMFNESFGASIGQSEYPVTSISPFATYKSREELEDKVDWLIEHPDLLENLRQTCEELAVEYFTPAPLAKRFLLYIHEAIK